MSTSRVKRRTLGVSTAAIAALAGAMFVPTSAVAATSSEGASRATAQFIGIPDSLLAGLSTEQIATIDGSTLVHGTSLHEEEWAADGAEAIVNSNAVEHQKGLDADLLATLDLPELALELQGAGGLGDIISLGAVTQYTKASRFGSSVGYAGTITDMDSAIETTDGYRITSWDPNEPAASVNVGTSQLGLSIDVGALYAVARDNQYLDSTIHASSYDIAGVEVAVGGDILNGVLGALEAPLVLLGVDLADAGLVDFDAGTVTVSLDALLESHGVDSVNDLSPGTNLLEHLPSAVVSIVDETVRGILPDLGILEPLLEPVYDEVINLLAGLATSLLDPLTSELASLLALNVNNVADENGVISVSALEVDIAEGGLVLPLATASAGGNAKATLGTGDVSISGTHRAGEYLTANPGSGWLPESWEVANPHHLALTYQWYSDGEPVDGADGKRLRLNSATIGTVIDVEVTASFPKANGASSATSTSVEVASNRISTSKTPTIKGDPTRGGTLVADFGDIYPDGADVSVIWYRDGVSVGRGLTRDSVWHDHGHEITFSYVIEKDGYIKQRGVSDNSVVADWNG